MVTLMNMLPLLEGWRKDYDYKPSVVIQPGTRFFLPSPTAWAHKGWLRWLYVRSNNPYVTIEHNMFAEKTHSFQPYLAFLDGIWMAPPDGQLYLTAYNTAQSRYVVMANPQPPLEFDVGAIMTITAPTVNPVTGAAILTPSTIACGWFAILITNEAKFKESLRAILGQKQTFEEWEAKKAGIEKLAEEEKRFGRIRERIGK